MPCSNCYSGCSEITSDQCVKYTGLDVPFLGIKKGDSLSYVEQALITFLGSTLDGSGIKITLTPEDYCALVTQYLPTCQDITALDLFKALVQSACNLQEQITVINNTLTTLNADYSVECLTGVTNSSDTHAVVQAVITKLCEVDSALTLLATDVDTNYVKIADINSYIAAYIAATATANRYYTRMIPYVAVEYYGPLTDFDATGAGIVGSVMENIYLCNGDNGTPDKRGRVTVGATTTPGVVPMSPTVDPSADPAFNPVYTLLAIAGSNKVILSTAQIPSHDHTLTVVDGEHRHKEFSAIASNGGGAPTVNANTTPDVRHDLEDGLSYRITGDTNNEATLGLSSLEPSNISVSMASAGGGQAHNNIQPSISAYYIMYIP